MYWDVDLTYENPELYISKFQITIPDPPFPTLLEFVNRIGCKKKPKPTN